MPQGQTMRFLLYSLPRRKNRESLMGRVAELYPQPTTDKLLQFYFPPLQLNPLITKIHCIIIRFCKI